MTVHERAGYLHVVVTGENTKENVYAYLKELLEECRARRCRRALVEERLEGPRMGTLEVFEIAVKGSLIALGAFSAVAYVDVNSEPGRLRFAEDMAVNRAIPMRVFATVAEAEEWLREVVRRSADRGGTGSA